MAHAAPSALRPRAFRPTWEIGASLGVHALIVGALFAGEMWTRPSKPLVDPEAVMMVTAVALPKQTSRLPDRPTRTPDPPKAAAPEAAPTPPPPPTASDLVLHKEDAPKPTGDPEAAPDRTQDREELLRQAQKAALLKDMSAAVGDVDRPRTDPNGVDPSEAIFGNSNAGLTDPELAKWWSKAKPAIWANWVPLPSTVSAHPEYSVQIAVIIDADGTMRDAEVKKGSPDSSFDRSALVAVVRTGKINPPPAKYAEAFSTGGMIIRFAAADKQ